MAKTNSFLTIIWRKSKLVEGICRRGSHVTRQSRLLKIGLHVVRKKGDTLPGTIISGRDSGLQIKWDDGKISNHRYDEMQYIRLTD
jgi:hypothetical protein